MKEGAASLLGLALLALLLMAVGPLLSNLPAPDVSSIRLPDLSGNPEAAAPGAAPASAPRVSAPDFQGHGPFVATASGQSIQWQPINGFTGPVSADFDPCQVLRILFGNDAGVCGWFAGEHNGTVQVEYKFDGQTMANGQSTTVNTNYPFDGTVPQEVLNTGTDRVWISHIQTVEAAQGNGIGGMTWEALDRAVYLHARSTGGPMVRVMSDAAGWGPRLAARLPADSIIWTNGTDMWVYDLARVFAGVP